MAPYREQCEMKQQLPQHTHRKWPAMPSWAAEGRSDYFYIFALQELAKRVVNRDLVLLLEGSMFCGVSFGGVDFVAMWVLRWNMMHRQMRLR